MMSFSDLGFAADAATDESFSILNFKLSDIVSVSAWLRIFFANLAWTFLTNQWVYWEVLWWDGLLWKLRNVMKNIANFGLWFYFVFTVFKWLIQQGKNDITKKLKDVILRLLIAWVWIQTSRFFTAAVIDVSTVTLTAAGSFPAQILDDFTYTEEAVRDSMAQFVWKEYTLFPKDSKATSLFATYKIEVEEKTPDEMIDALIPDENDVAWPLYFIWFSLLKTYKINSINTSSIKWLKASILNLVINWWATVVYMFEMILLCVIALIRIIYLRMFIVLSPIAILLQCIEKAAEKSWDKKIFESWLIKWLRKHIKLKTFFINVFKPTIIVLCFWVALIFVAQMNKVVLDYTWQKLNLGWVELSSKKDAMSNINWNEWDQTYTTVIDSNLLHFVGLHAWKTMLEFILSIITIIIVYIIINVGIKMWNGDDFMWKKISWLTKWLGNLMWSMPVIPFVWYDEHWMPKESSISFNWLKKIPAAFGSKLESSINGIAAEQEDKVKELWWLKNTDSLSSTDKAWIKNAWMGVTWWWYKILEAKRSYINNSIKSDKWKWMILNPNASDKFWIQQFKDWLNERVDKNDYGADPKEWRNMIDDWKNINPTDKSKRDLKILFDKPNHAKTYANFFGYTSWNYNKFSDIMDLDISKK